MVLAVFAVLVLLFVVLPLIGLALWVVLTSAIVGVILGALRRLIVPGTQRIGALATVCCGLVGSLLGGGISHGAGLHRISTLLVEIAVSGVAVAIWSATHRKGLPPARGSHQVIDV